MNKMIIGLILGIVMVSGVGFTYEVINKGLSKQTVDVRIVEVGGHEYVVGTSYGSHDYVSGVNVQTSTDRRCLPSREHTYGSSVSSAITIVHHVGCRTCSKQ